jgi:prophage regulatory protein
MNVAILRMPQAMQKVGLARSTIYMLMKKGAFPSPIKLSERAIGWPESVLNDWIEARTAATIAQREA